MRPSIEPSLKTTMDTSSHDADSAPAKARAPTAFVLNPLEHLPPKQRAVGSNPSGPSITHNGDTFYFCCIRCKETFDQEPSKHIAQRSTG